MKEIHLTEIDSTQNYAKNLILNNEKNVVVVADMQTSGRGRNGHTWTSPHGGLWFSFDVNFHSDFPTLVIGIAAMEVLKEEYNCELKIKWPNDLILDGKKVGGILCEKVNNEVIAGIGINTNVKNIELNTATSLFNKTNKVVDNIELMKKIINKCNEFSDYSKEKIITIFRSNMAYIGEKCFISSLQSEAKILDVTNDGKLVVETGEGIKEINSGEINVCI